MKQANILLTDSNAASIAALETTLSPLGVTLIHASSRAEILQQLLEQEFALIILNAEHINDVEAVPSIMDARGYTTPILILSTGGTAVEELIGKYPPGTVDYLPKPLAPYNLLTRVSLYVQLYHKNTVLQQHIEEIGRLSQYIDQTRHIEHGNWFQMTLHSIGDAVLAIDRESRISFINPVAERLTGWPQAEAVGRKVSDVFHIIHERTRQPAFNPVERVLKEGVIIGLANHTVLISKDGTEYPIDDSAAPIRDNQGNVVGAIVVFRDVSQIKRAQQLKTRLAAIIQDSDDAIIGKDLDGIITSWNRGAERMYGYTAEEVLGKSVTILLPPNGINDVPQILDRIKRGEGIGHYETRRMCKDGTVIDVSLTVSPIHDEDGNVVGASKIARNITQQKRLQSLQILLAAIVESSDDAIIGKDLNGVVTSWNKGAQRMYGYTSEEMVGQPIARLIPPGYPNDVPIILDRIKQREQVVHYETKRMAKDGHVLDVSLTVSPIHDEHGNVIGASKIARDITERKRRERELATLLKSEQQAKEQLEQALHSRDEFLSVAAHELRTPVTSLRGFAQTLIRHYNRTGTIDSDRLQTALSHIDEQSTKLSVLVNQLLDISRIEAGKLTISCEPTDLTVLVQGVIEQEQINTERHRITLDAPPIAEANIDPIRIEQVITNLIDNAIKYSSGDLIEVVITKPNAEWVRISVTDQGEGIPPEHRSKLFERYYQAHAMSSGMGLGLYISRQIIELHQGRIYAQFPDAGGTRFVIELPVGDVS